MFTTLRRLDEVECCYGSRISRSALAWEVLLDTFGLLWWADIAMRETVKCWFYERATLRFAICTSQRLFLVHTYRFSGKFYILKGISGVE